MSKKYILMAGIVLIGLIIFIFNFKNPEEKIIREVITSAISHAEFDGSLNIFDTKKRVDKLEKIFSVNVKIQAIDGKRKIVRKGWKIVHEYILLATRLFKSSNLTIKQLKINIKGDKAETIFSVIITGEDKGNNPFRELVFCWVNFKQIDKKWLIEKVVVERNTPK